MILGFRASKCKTSCKLCVSRIKLNRNKREIQLTHQRREIGNLLKQGKNEYAWIRVEAVIREQNLLAAYEILELYLELIAVRVELLDKHRTCPNDMVEAITTLMFAAPRVADLPELAEVKKWLSLKYGRELGVEGGRSSNGEEPQTWQVNRRLRQYLSVAAPDPEDKLTAISQIAQEFGAEFNMETFAESVAVQVEPEFASRPPPYPDFSVPNFAPPVQQAPPGPPPGLPSGRPYSNYPVPQYGNVPPTVVTPASPGVHEPKGEAPVMPPAQPSFRVPHQGPSSGPYTDAQLSLMGKACQDDTAMPIAPPPLSPEEEEYQRRQKQYDDMPGPPKKEAFHEDAKAEDEFPVPPSAPPDIPPLPPADGSLDSDLSSRLAALRKR